jgi:small subunit ribosomal protein S17
MKDDMKQKKIAIRRSFEGEVVASRNKTAYVRVKTTKMHPKYRKQYVTSRKYAVHDELGSAKIGDVIKFVECRPISKSKRWRLQSVIKTAKA